MPYSQNKQFLRNYKKYPNQPKPSNKSESSLLQYILNNIPPNDPQAAIDGINHFCQTNWMMNLGQDKVEVVKTVLKQYNPTTILELGGYCGYSALAMAHYSKAVVHTIEINQQFAAIANRIHKHAGIDSRIIIHVGTVSTQQHFIVSLGKIDMVFIDHVKNLYLQDLMTLSSYGSIQKGTVVVGDNIVYPGAPDYLNYFKNSQQFDSVLYHSYLEYSDMSDAVLVSHKIE